MAITLIKLKNGIEVIGHINKVNNSVVELQDPMQINYKSSEVSGIPTLSFTKYCPFSTESIFKFDMEHILHVTPVRKSAEDYYVTALEFYRNVSEKHLDKELKEASLETSSPDTDHMKSFLKKVKIYGYAH